MSNPLATMVGAAVGKVASGGGLIQKVVFKSNVTPPIDLTQTASGGGVSLAGLGQELDQAGAFVRWAKPAVYVTTPAGVIKYAPYGEPGDYFYPVAIGTLVVGGVLAYYFVKGVLCLYRKKGK